MTYIGLFFLVVLALYGWDSFVMAPLRLLVVVFHEGGHALMTWLTGGRVVEIALDVRGGGHTLSEGGMPLLILNAGYLGSLASGLALLRAAKGPARAACGAVGALLLATLAWMPISAGLLYTAAAGLGFCALAVRASPEVCRWILRGIGVFSVLYALVDVRLDAGAGDAAILAARTGVPSLVWTGLWLVTGAASVWVIRRRIV